MTKPKVYFRCDASPEIGSGHVFRCLTIANALKDHGWSCVFATQTDSASVVPALESYETIKPEDLKEEADLLVVDHYGLDKDFEKSCRSLVKRILVIDDLADRDHDCDVLLDQTFGREEKDYQGLVSAECKILAGASYALLRPQFSKNRMQSL